MHDSHSSPGNLLSQTPAAAQQQQQHHHHQSLHHPIAQQFAPGSSSVHTFNQPDAFSSLFPGSPSHPYHQPATATGRAPLPPAAIKTEADQKPYSNPAGFVHRLYDMVEDRQYQHLISWNYPGTTFVVCNVVEFAKDVLPKHYKHNNFSSFVRQLNMYGFRKVSKSPRGHKTSPESQIWEFSHPRFQRGRSDLLDDIKRKQGDNLDMNRTPVGDVPAGVAMLQISQTDLMQRVNSLQDTLSDVLRDLHETKQRQAAQQDLIKKMKEFMEQQGFQFQSQLLDRFDASTQNLGYQTVPPAPPSILLSPQNGFSSSMLPPEPPMNRHRQSYVRGNSISSMQPQMAVPTFSPHQHQQPNPNYLFHMSSRLLPATTLASQSALTAAHDGQKCNDTTGEHHNDDDAQGNPSKKRKYDVSPKNTANSGLPSVNPNQPYFSM
ncbi:Heat shock factor protein [Neolecta irregularis DAH-3]|uniref:Heat shock factor protein n=1 Tax=Neolecta irregularis (strain DAH-3) TaxID=1198029 RepID=A0A1U7LSR2_NEOID|nr:Heat shock factor protein [Neolecta irregularis DAH-3]|eukprot:OLL25582.1 Heat shock factor protein [Neolecta irregularis DAH-3]